MRIPSARLALTSLITFTLAPTLISLVPLTGAYAAPLPASYSASAEGDLVGLDATLLAPLPPLASARIGHSASDVDSDRTTDDVTAESSNLAAALVFGGGNVAVNEQRAVAEPTQDPDAATLLSLPVLRPVANVGVITADTYADYAGDDACAPAVNDQRVLSDSVTTLAGLSVPEDTALLDPIVSVGASDIRTSTKLVDDGTGGSDVVSSTQAVLGDVDLFGGDVSIDVGTSQASPVTVNARSDGTTGSSELVNPPVVTATVGGTSIPVPLNGQPVDLDVPGNPLAEVTLTAFDPDDADDSVGAVGAADLQYLLRVQVEVLSVLGATVADIDLNLAPLSVRAEAPAGGVECANPDVVAPTAPEIDDPADDDIVTDRTPTISGSGAEPGSTVTVFSTDGTTVLCTDTTVGSDGLWSCSPTADLPLGDQTVTATSSDEAGNESDPSAAVTFTIEASADTTAPDAPAILAPADGSNTDDMTPTVSGTAEANSTVLVTEGGVEICTAETNALGAWSCTPTTPLTEGEHTFDAVAEDAAGNISEADSVTFTVNDTTAPAAPQISEPVEGSSTDDTTPTVVGTAEPGSTVTVTEGGVEICTAPVGPQGNWSCTPTTELDEGEHTFDAVAEDGAGNTSPADTVTFTVTQSGGGGDTTPPNAPVITSPADGSQVTDTTPTVTGQGEPDSTVTVREGQTVICSTTVAANGTWSCTTEVPLGEGSHTFTATASDPAGNVSQPASTTFTVVTVTTVPPGPVPAPVPAPGTDTDDDGLTDDEEVDSDGPGPDTGTGTNPQDSDSDGDGLADGKEVTSIKSDPKDADTDNDSLKDGVEVDGMAIKERFEICGQKARTKIRVSTNPLAKDTDKDGLGDGREVKGYVIKQQVIFTRAGQSFKIGKTRTNPAKADTDKDGLKDKVEKSGSANNAWQRRKTDPTKCDTDGGGARDGREIKAGSDPSRIKSGPNDLKNRMSRPTFG